MVFTKGDEGENFLCGKKERACSEKAIPYIQMPKLQTKNTGAQRKRTDCDYLQEVYHRVYQEELRSIYVWIYYH